MRKPDVALANSYNLAVTSGSLPYAEAASKAKERALQALEIDDRVDGGHAELARAELYLDWDWVAADREFRREVELNPNSAVARGLRCWFLSLLGRREEAIGEASGPWNWIPSCRTRTIPVICLLYRPPV